MGPGFQHSSSIAGTDVAFGPGVCGASNCYSLITSPDGHLFQLVTATVAAGYSSGTLTVTAYNSGTYVVAWDFSPTYLLS